LQGIFTVDSGPNSAGGNVTENPITAEMIVARNDALPATAVDDELVVLNVATNNYIGRRIWNLLQQPHRVDDLCRLLGEEFFGDAAVIADDTTAFLENLNKEGLLKVAGP